MATYKVVANRKEGSVYIVNSDMPEGNQEWYFYGERLHSLIKALQEAQKFLVDLPEETWEV